MDKSGDPLILQNSLQFEILIQIVYGTIAYQCDTMVICVLPSLLVMHILVVNSMSSVIFLALPALVATRNNFPGLTIGKPKQALLNVKD